MMIYLYWTGWFSTATLNQQGVTPITGVYSMWREWREQRRERLVSQSHDSIDGYNCRSWGLQLVTTPLCLVGNRDAIPVCMWLFQTVISSVLLVTGIWLSQFGFEMFWALYVTCIEFCIKSSKCDMIFVVACLDYQRKRNYLWYN